MTAALNLGLLGNNVNTSGQVSLTAGVSGTLPVANGGIGTTTLTANNVLLGNGASAPQVVAPGTSGNVLQSNGTTWVSSTVPAPSTTQVLSATSGASFGAVGTYMFARYNTQAVVAPGATVAGSTLNPFGMYDITRGILQPAGATYGTAQSGTWRCMAYVANFACGCSGIFSVGVTLWLRVS